MRNYYEVLGITKKATADEVKRAYRDLARKYHPDNAGPESTAKFQEIQLAYNVLSNPTERAKYDSGNVMEQSADGVEVPDFADIFQEIFANFDIDGLLKNMNENYAHVPRIAGWDVISENDTYHIKLNYNIGVPPEIYEKHEWSLPIFSDLVETPPNGSIEENQLKSMPLPKKPENIFRRIFSYIFPYAILMVFSFVIAVLCSHGALFATALFAISASCYAITGRLLRNYIVSRTAAVEEFIDNEEMFSANKTFRSLSWSFVLLGLFNNSTDLKWKYFYLDGCIGEKWNQFERAENSYKEALKLSTTDDERFLCLKGLINLYSELARRSDFNPYYAEKINECMSQIPLGALACIKIINNLREKVHSCLQSLIDKSFVEALDKFAELHVGGFVERSCFGEMILLHQLKISLTLIGMHEGHGKLDAESRLLTARAHLNVINDYVSKYYPDKIQMTRDCIDSLEALMKSGIEYSDLYMKRKDTTMLFAVPTFGETLTEQPADVDHAQSLADTSSSRANPSLSNRG